MPMYQYSGYGSRGQRVRGKIKAVDQASAEESLRGLGLYVTRIRVTTDAWWNQEIYIGRKVSVRDFAVFCRQLATLIRAGVPLMESMRVLINQTANKPLREALERVSDEVSEGKPLSDSLSARPDIFPTMFVSMTRAGEYGGNLDETLDRVARYFEREFYTREKVKSALAYPVLLGVVSILVTLFILVKIVPTFVPVFASYQTTLPLPTRIVLGISHFMEHDWWVVILVLCIMIFGDMFGKRQIGYKARRDRMILRIPVIGTLYQKTLVARLSRTMGSLLSSAVPMLQSLNIVRDVVDNHAIGDTLDQAANGLQEGRSLSNPFKSNHFIPPMVSQMMAIGEESGNLEFMLSKMADFYEAEVEANADRLRSLLEPVMIIFLAGVVGLIVLAVLMPSFTLLQTLQ